MIRWLLALALALGTAAPARADQDRPPLPDELSPDYDAKTESYSDFWEQALRPHAKEYDAKLRTAQVEIKAMGHSALKLANAERLLKEAIALEPDTPEGYWLLGDVYEIQKRWAECAEQRQKVFDLDPGYVPEAHGRNTRSWLLDSKLAQCLALAGDYEDAIDHYKRILAGGDTAASYAHLDLAMTFMALGRINDAIDSYEEAMDDSTTNPRRPRKAAFMYFGAAVAYDRDEQVGRSKELLDLALRYDRSLSAFSEPHNRFLIPADEHYFRGLAESANPRRRAFAIAYFRRYIAVAGDAGWTRRAEDHLAQLSAETFGDDDIVIRGAGVIDAKKARGAVVRAADEMHACLEDAPDLLFRVTLTKVSAGDGTRSRRARPTRKHERRAALGARKPIAPPQPGVRVRQELAFDTATRTVFDAQACVTEAARSINLPKVTGSLHSYATVEFLLIAR